MRSLVAIILVSFVATSAWGGAYTKGGGSGGSGGTESVGGVTRVTSQTEPLVIGTHGTPEITLNPTTKAIDIAAGTAGQCAVLKEASANGGNTATSCAADALDASYTCTFEDGAYIGAGCPQSRLFWTREPAATVTTVTSGNGIPWASSTIYPSAGASTEVILYPGFADYLQFTKLGVYEIEMRARGAIKSATASDCSTFKVVSNDVTVIHSQGGVFTNGTTATPLPKNGRMASFHALVQVTALTDPYIQFSLSKCGGVGAAVSVEIYQEHTTGDGLHSTILSVRRID